MLIHVIRLREKIWIFCFLLPRSLVEFAVELSNFIFSSITRLRDNNRSVSRTLGCNTYVLGGEGREININTNDINAIKTNLALGNFRFVSNG